MRAISFLARFTFICNIAFLLFAVINLIDAHHHAKGASPVLEPIPFLKDIIITLGFSAIIINLLMCLTYLVIIIIKRKFPLPKWLTIVNFIFLPLEFYFFFS